MKRIVTLLLCFALLLCLSSCTYNPPEGWTKRHHSYEEILAFAKSIDPDAVVSEEYIDTVDENNWEFREWDAVINGVSCHVSSISDWVWNSGFAAGEFVKIYYRIDTDYDYVVLNHILTEDHPRWKTDESMRSKYHHNTNTLWVELQLSEYRMLSSEELEEMWLEASEINRKYEKSAVQRKAGFMVPSPRKGWTGVKEEYVVMKDGAAHIREYTEQGKADFLQEYYEDWALLESGLPIVD